MKEEKKHYRGFTPAQAEAHKRYMENFVEIKVRTTPEKREEIKTHARNQNESLNSFVNRAIDEAIEHDNQQEGSN